MPPPAYFISDVHLTLVDGDAEREKRRRLFHFFEMVRSSGGTLFIVGDFFDFWFEYRHVIPKRYFDVLNQFYLLRAAGIDIHFVLGNHDFWTNGFLNGSLGIQVHPSAAQVDFDGHSIHLTHGDGLLARDGGYRLLRRVLRSRISIFLYRWLHPDWGIALAQAASRYSRKRNQGSHDEDAIFDELAQYAHSRWDEGCDLVVMGHYHLHRLHTNSDGKSLLCLGDWISHNSYGKYSQGEISLESWDG